MSQVPDSNCKGLLVIFMTTKKVLTNIGALLANKSARSQIRKKEVLTSPNPSFSLGKVSKKEKKISGIFH